MKKQIIITVLILAVLITCQTLLNIFVFNENPKIILVTSIYWGIAYFIGFATLKYYIGIIIKQNKKTYK